ncbi:MAG: hypothetical protein QMD86_01960 [Patescibacteria group bacterium]|nr:hypothetical protein [Patescibacteria group bacterium]
MYNNNILEKDIERLAHEVRELSAESNETPSKKIVKQALAPIIKNIPSVPQTDDDNKKISDKTESKILPDYMKDSSPEMKLKVEKLLDMVFHKGIEKAVAEARDEEPFFLDAFHDALADKLYEELKKRNIIKT